jgi:hypothetical protein
LALELSKGEKVVANKKLQVGSRSSKKGACKGIVGKLVVIDVNP